MFLCLSQMNEIYFWWPIIIRQILFVLSYSNSNSSSKFAHEESMNLWNGHARVQK